MSKTIMRKTRLHQAGLTAILLGIAGVSGCTFVALVPEAEGVGVLESVEAAAPDCEALSITRVKVLDRVGIFARNKGKVAAELETMARNAAVEISGNFIAPVGPIDEGMRRFQILRCP